MTQISNRKKKFIKENLKRFSIEELARHTGLKPDVVRALINESNAEVSMHGKSSHMKKRTPSLPSWKIILLTALLFMVTAFAIYSPSLNGEFIFDDQAISKDSLIHITHLSQLLDLVIAKEPGRRIGWITFALNYYWGEFNPLGYHLVNIVIHTLNGIMLFLLSFTMLTLFSGKREDRKGVLVVAFLGSLLWLVHPLQSQAVAYIVQRLTSLCTLFFLLSLFCYLQGRLTHTRRRLIFLVLSLLFGLLAIDTKQNAATLPLFIILAEFFYFQRDSFITNKKRLWILIVGGGLFVLIAGMYLGPDFITRIAEGYEKRGWTMPERLLTELRVVVFYLGLLIYPHPSRLNLDHDFTVSTSLLSPLTTVLSLVVILGLMGLSLWMVRRNRLVAYTLLWFLGNLVIESSIIPLELVFEHRMYLPSMSIIVLGAGIVVWMFKEDWRRWGIGGMLVVSLVFSYWTYERAFVWRDQISLWMDAVQKSPHKARPHSNLGSAYGKKEMFDEAISECKKSLAINPNEKRARSILGMAYFTKGMVSEAIAEHKKALAIDPNLAELHYNLGIAYAEDNRLDEAIAEYKKALTINPNHAETHNNLGIAFGKKDMLDEAIVEYKQALAINPDFALARNNLGAAYNKKGLVDKAIAEYKMALEIDSNLVTAYYGLADSYDKKGMVDESIFEYQKVLTINPDHAEAYYNMGLLLEAQGKMADAISAYREVIRIKPKQSQAYNNVAWIYATSPDKNIRNGDEAVLLATKACELTEFKNVWELDTLAAAYAEKGNFVRAIEYQEMALSLVEEKLKPHLLKRLDLYQARQPYRDK